MGIFCQIFAIYCSKFIKFRSLRGKTLYIPTGTRVVPLSEFYTWSGETVVDAGELIEAVTIPVPDFEVTETFEKYAQWRGDFAEASVAVRLGWQGNDLCDARVAFGSVSPLPSRSNDVEQAFLAAGPTKDSVRAAAEHAVHGALPLRDNASKVSLLVNLTERALTRALARRAG